MFSCDFHKHEICALIDLQGNVFDDDFIEPEIIAAIDEVNLDLFAYHFHVE
jgi:hypothetical protein